MTANRRSGNQVDLTWDVVDCVSPEYHLLFGDSAGLPTLTYSGAVCDLGPSGAATVTVPQPEAGHATWWIITGASGPSEGPHGYDSSGGLRDAEASGLCGLTSQTTAAACH